jgi:hypothetical protein
MMAINGRLLLSVLAGAAALTLDVRVGAADSYVFKETVKYRFTGKNPYHRDKITQKFKTQLPVSAVQALNTDTLVRVTLGTSPTGMSHTVEFRLGDDPGYVPGTRRKATVLVRNAGGKLEAKHVFKWNKNGAAKLKSKEVDNPFMGFMYMGVPQTVNVPKNGRFQLGGLSNEFNAPITGASKGTADKGNVKLKAKGSAFQPNY